MPTIQQTAISRIALSFLFAITATRGMEQLQLSEKKPRPTIKAKIWLKPNKSAFYLTQKSIELLTSKGITTPIVRVGLKVDKVEVIEQNGKTITNWKKEIPELVQSYELQQLLKKAPNFEKTLAGCFTINTLTFPKRLPAELALHCSNGTRICLTVHGFPVEATFESQGIFHKEYEESMNAFFAHPCSSEVRVEEKFILIQENIMSGPQTFQEALRATFDALTSGVQNTCPFGHGSKGCPNKERFLELIKNHKVQTHLTPHHKNITTLLLNRQTGLVRKEPYRQLLATLGILSIKLPHTTPKHRSKCEQVDIENKLAVDQRDEQLPSTSEQVDINSDRILEECLAEMEADNMLDEYFDEFQANDQQA